MITATYYSYAHEEITGQFKRVACLESLGPFFRTLPVLEIPGALSDEKPDQLPRAESRITHHCHLYEYQRVSDTPNDETSSALGSLIPSAS
jgi:hypothetical protein